jgi:hypothetical protein
MRQETQESISSKYKSDRPTKFFEQTYKQRQNSQTSNNSHSNGLNTGRVSKIARPEDEEPICVLKIEFDGEKVEEIRVYKSDEPHELVQQFGKQFNLSESAKQRLFDQI